MSVATVVVRASALVLPSSIRERYREQWLADVRDANEAGLRPTSIALAALSFAVLSDRPFPSRPVPTAEQRAQRSRLALGLAFSAALLALSVYPRVSFGGLTGITAVDYLTFFLTMLLFAYAVLAPIAALVLVRGKRERWAVALLALATTAPLVAAAGIGRSNNIYLNGIVVFVIAAVLIGLACGLCWRPNGRSLRAPILGALAVWAVTAGGLVYGAVIAWPARTPLAFGEPTQEYYTAWLQLKIQFEALVNQTFVAWAITGAAIGILVFVIGRRMSERRAAALGLTAVAISLLGAAGVFGLLELGVSGTVAEALLDPLRLTAQMLLVSVVLIAVGGLRFEPKRSAGVRHRHDVEGAVELL